MSIWWAPNNWRQVRRWWESACCSPGVDISVLEEAFHSNTTVTDSPLNFPRIMSIAAMWSDPSSVMARIYKFARMTNLEIIISVKFLARAFTFAEWQELKHRKVLDRILLEFSCIPICPWCNLVSRCLFAVWARSRVCSCLDTRFL